MIINVKTTKVLEMPILWRLVLKFIYDKKNVSLADEKLMENNIVKWAQKLDFDRAMGRVWEIEEEQLGIIASMLKKNESGGFDKQIELFARHNIDYRKFYRLPEAYKPEDFVRAKEEYEKLKKIKPEENS